MSDWYNTSVSVIRAALEQAKDQGLDEAATRRLVNAAYPFGPRSHHPYKMWRKAFRDVMDGGTASAKRDREKLAAWNAAWDHTD